MPTYEYVCRDCGHGWEAFQSIKDSALKNCAKCGKETAERVITGGAGFILKGGGWYSDLYGTPKAKSEGKSDGNGSASNGNGKSTGAASESKSETKTDSKSPTDSTPPAKSTS